MFQVIFECGLHIFVSKIQRIFSIRLVRCIKCIQVRLSVIGCVDFGASVKYTSLVEDGTQLNIAIEYFIVYICIPDKLIFRFFGEDGWLDEKYIDCCRCLFILKTGFSWCAVGCVCFLRKRSPMFRQRIIRWRRGRRFREVYRQPMNSGRARRENQSNSKPIAESIHNSNGMGKHTMLRIKKVLLW